MHLRISFLPPIPISCLDKLLMSINFLLPPTKQSNFYVRGRAALIMFCVTIVFPSVSPCPSRNIVLLQNLLIQTRSHSTTNHTSHVLLSLCSSSLLFLWWWWWPAFVCGPGELWGNNGSSSAERERRSGNGRGEEVVVVVVVVLEGHHSTVSTKLLHTEST